MFLIILISTVLSMLAVWLFAEHRNSRKAIRISTGICSMLLFGVLIVVSILYVSDEYEKVPSTALYCLGQLVSEERSEEAVVFLRRYAAEETPSRRRELIGLLVSPFARTAQPFPRSALDVADDAEIVDDPKSDIME
jgi:hypothetical protein